MPIVSDARKLIERISTYQPLRILNQILSHQLEGTTEWLLELPEIVNWKFTPDPSAAIWLSGNGLLSHENPLQRSLESL